MKNETLKKVLFVILVGIAITNSNLCFSVAATTESIDPPPEYNFMYFNAHIVIEMGKGNCEWYYVIVSEFKFSEYNDSMIRLKRFYNSRVMNPLPDADYSEFLYDCSTIIEFWQLPSTWTECYFGVVCVNESSNLWSYPIISRKISIPEGLEPPDPDPILPQPPSPAPPSPKSNSIEGYLPIITILSIGIGIILSTVGIDYLLKKKIK
uniref:Uncharacterized protein n=1 Tax=Promethearchaeum syntrophicum TaxID=2594042 RepID=A0A5B9DG14_9ARCH|nr:hypothetical protein [Candidatus Prometheoarchaeum syntrophicum]QEE17720.1 hypothetical protein DSAG12_03558 [Candidatus Prometheoarchaeum syntrophicum]